MKILNWLFKELQKWAEVCPNEVKFNPKRKQF